MLEQIADEMYGVFQEELSLQVEAAEDVIILQVQRVGQGL